MKEAGEKTPELTKAQIQKYRMMFSLIDQDGDDRISQSDLEAAFKDIGVNVDNSVISEDMLKGGSIDFNQFLNIVASKFNGFSDQEELQDAFATFQGPDGIDGKILRQNLVGIADSDDTKQAVTSVVDEFTKENKITGYEKFEADKFVDICNRILSIKRSTSTVANSVNCCPCCCTRFNS